MKFIPAWWLPGPHLQTLWPSLLRRRLSLATQQERLELEDGDFLDLSWVGSGNGPRVLVLHGLNGSVNSHYVNGILAAIAQRGWRGVLVHFRGCSNEPNRLARSYHSGETSDLHTVINELCKREPASPIFVVGYSLGGNVLLKALAETQQPNLIKAAVAISVPFQLNKTADHLCKGFSRVYQWKLVHELKQKHFRKFKKISIPMHLRDVSAAKTFWEFDDKVTAPLHGFASAQDYYNQSSSKQYLKKIQTPTLILHARDDPFTTLCSLPTKDEVAKCVKLEIFDHGGHVGFVAGKYPWRPVYWLDQKIIRYLVDSV